MLKIVKRLETLFQYHDLLLTFIINDLKVKYRNPFLGFFWIVFAPLCQVIILKIVFSHIIKVSVPGLPFFIFLITGFFPWVYFNNSIIQAAESITANASLIKKANFPREILPISAIISNLIHFFIILIITVIIIFLTNIQIPFAIIYLPLIVILETFICIGIGLITSSLQVYFRDVKYFVEIILMALFYLTPVFYPLTLVENISKPALQIYLLNPLACLITLYRLVLLKGYYLAIPANVSISQLILIPICAAIFVLLLGFWIFRKYERGFFNRL